MYRRHFVKHGLALAALAAAAPAPLISPALAKGVDTFTSAPFTDKSTALINHSAWDGLLKTYVVVGSDGLNRFDYAALKAKDQPTLKAYIKALEAEQPTKLGRDEAFAYWANLYNAKTVDIVLDAYPVKSIKDIKLGGGLLAAVTGGPWKAKSMKVNGIELSLDDIEHTIMRPVFKDPRVHYAVNCASVGCPNLGTEAFTGPMLDQQLTAAAAAYINSPRGLRVDADGVTASSIYDWFVADFGGHAKGVLTHAKRYASDALKAKLEGISEIEDYDYDWSLNDTKAPAK
jgi:hypothetical protein